MVQSHCHQDNRRIAIKSVSIDDIEDIANQTMVIKQVICLKIVLGLLIRTWSDLAANPNPHGKQE